MVAGLSASNAARRAGGGRTSPCRSKAASNSGSSGASSLPQS